MSGFSTKLRQGILPNERDWNEHLIEGHAKAPSQTPLAFASFKTSEGINSYQILAQELEGIAERDIKIVDLACGDGHLISYLLPGLANAAQIIGVDMSESELVIARKAVTDARVSFRRARAQQLPLDAESIDLIVCHMAFMLMSPLDPVVAEISRVLKPGGRFSAIVGNRGNHQGLFLEISNAISQYIDSRYPKVKETSFGDARVFSAEGLRSMFSEDLGFHGSFDRAAFGLRYDIPPEKLWDLFGNMYHVGVLTDKEQLELRELLIQLAQKHMNRNGTIQFEFSMCKLSVSKR